MTEQKPFAETPPVPGWALLVTVFTGGACVLVIELMGTRMLAPYFGSGIYTWSALIAITMAALSLGYAFGGHLADRLPRARILYSLCLAAGLWILSTPTLARPLLAVLIQVPDVRIGVLLSASLLFFPSLFTLGTFCPFVIRLMTREAENAGSVSGLVFAVSTIGSLLGALGTGFILIPNFGVVAIFTFCGSFLIALAMLANFRPKFIGYSSILVSVLVLLMIVTGKRPGAETSVELLGQVSSYYGQLQVIRKQGVKSLLVDGIGQNYVYQDDATSTAYINFISALPELRQAQTEISHKALVIGLGAGQLPMRLQQQGLQPDVVEIDPEVGRLAEEHFGLDLNPEQIHYMDGRLFLLRTANVYEYIALDAFNAEQIASHLLSMEALAEARARLSRSGILAINLTSLATAEDVASLQATLRAVYDHVRVFSLDHGSTLTSIVFLASMQPIILSTEHTSLTGARLADAKRFIAGELPELGSDTLLTDDYNPISQQRKQVQLLWRKAMIDYLGNGSLDWLMF